MGYEKQFRRKVGLALPALLALLLCLGISASAWATNFVNGGFEAGGPVLSGPNNAAPWVWTPGTNGERVNVLTNNPADPGNGSSGGAPLITPLFWQLVRLLRKRWRRRPGQRRNLTKRVHHGRPASPEFLVDILHQRNTRPGKSIQRSIQRGGPRQHEHLFAADRQRQCDAHDPSGRPPVYALRRPRPESGFPAIHAPVGVLFAGSVGPSGSERDRLLQCR